ncbi:ricin-type beta-trefoil lectin domain protein [Streptacidiphilus sp. ASG 303]|uniref:ricin-type beta-trefoil lectin domain protein n=1 Tax=Streptacidiphilus sp. ASG 303 TaxID=2896847 RepID=UPI001E3569B9|nr:ricin-type beta-trefoil lectin domain protein [Streptacidiphilus sp. ASG 303]MCD0485623.1 ricin-type beta-trefoil lectin domain protein [Streptacidiphilus sp. ASG 303]
MSQLHRFDQSDRPRTADAAGTADTLWGEASLDAPPCTSMPDAELARLLRSDEPIAHEALDELRRRHLPGTLSYARICTRDSHAAEELADDAFQAAQRAVQASGGPKEAWRHHLLMLVQRTAAGWAATTRRAELAPDFAAWLDEERAAPAAGHPDTGSPESRSLMLLSFRSLPERTQALLWHAVVEEDDDATTGHLLGIEPQSVPYLREKAREAYRDVYLQVHTENSAGEDCRRFSGLVEAAARRSGVHQNEDLDRHLAGCPRCSRLLTDLVGMDERPDAVLAEGLLLWGGAAYVAARLARTVTGRTIPVGVPRLPGTGPAHAPAVHGGASGATDGGGGPFGGTRAGAADTASAGWRLVRLARQFPAAGAAAAVVFVVATAATTIVTLVPSTSTSAAGGGNDPLGGPPLVVTGTTAFATVTTTLPASRPPSAPASAPGSASASPKASGPSASPGAPGPSSGTGRAPGASGRPAPGRSVPVPPPPTNGITYSELVNVRSGLCLDVASQFVAQNADVVVSTCTGATTQKWYTGSDNLIRNYANPDFCLDSRGSTGNGVGIWECSAVSGSNGNNLRWQNGADGSIRPFVDSRFALTPTSGTPGTAVGLAWAEGRTEQTWRTGATAVLQG